MFTRAELAALCLLALVPGNTLGMSQPPIHSPGQLSPVRLYFKQGQSLPGFEADGFFLPGETIFFVNKPKL